MKTIKLEDITFGNNHYIMVPYEGPRGVCKQRLRVDMRSLNKRNILPGLVHFTGVVENVRDRRISFWRLNKQKKMKDGHRLKFSSHFDNEEDAMKAYADFNIKAKMYDRRIS